MDENGTVSFRPVDYDIFIGMDVDKRSNVITIMDHNALLARKKIPYEPANLIKYIAKTYPDKRAAFVYEAGPTGYGLYDELESAGYSCLVATPSKVPIIPGSQIKTNRLDSEKLAQSLRSGQIRGIRVPKASYRQLRHLSRLRDNFVRQVVRCKCQVKSLLVMEGLPFPDTDPGGRWSQKRIAELRENSIYDPIRFKLNCLLDTLDFTHNQVVITQKEIRRFCQTDEEIADSIKYIMSVPGVGWVVASEMVARIGDWRLLKNARELGAFLGLTPSEKSTGDDIRRGGIVNTGHRRARKKLIEGSWMAVRRDDELRSFYHRIMRRNPRHTAAQKAIVAVARKITCRIYRVLKDRRCYVIRNSIKFKYKLVGAKVSC